MHQRVTRRPLYRRLPSLLGHTPRWQAGVAARLPCLLASLHRWLVSSG